MIISLHRVLVDLFFCHFRGFVRVFPDMINKTVNQVLVDFLKTVKDKTDQININRFQVEPGQSENGIIINKRGIIFDIFIGNPELGRKSHE